MGARRRRLTTRPPIAVGVSLLYALLAAALVFAAAELLNSDITGPWLDLAGAAVLGLALLTTVLFVRTALLRRRERLAGRGWGWAAAASASSLVALAALLFLATILQVEPTLSGADVRETRPILDDLPVPPHASLVSERPGLAGTESIVADYRVRDLSRVAAFYRQALPRSGWSSEDTAPSDSLLRYRKGDFVVIVVIDLNRAAATDYTLTVDRAPVPAASPAASPT